jgi:hypothetical protein
MSACKLEVFFFFLDFKLADITSNLHEAEIKLYQFFSAMSESVLRKI